MATSRKSKSPKAAATKSASKKVKKKASAARKAKKAAGGKSPAPKRAPAKTKAKAATVRTKKKPAAAPAKKSLSKPKPPKPRKPRKPSVDPALIKTIREALVLQRRQLESMMQSTRAQMADKQSGLADLIDQATEGFEDELALGLLKIEAAQIGDIVAAIARIDEGSYGLCEDCGKPIPRKRLEILPFALRCLNCKGTRERQARIGGNFDDDD